MVGPASATTHTGIGPISGDRRTRGQPLPIVSACLARGPHPEMRWGVTADEGSGIDVVVGLANDEDERVRQVRGGGFRQSDGRLVARGGW